MPAPTIDFVRKVIRNPDASMPLVIPILVVSNTPEEDLYRNVEANSALPLQWVRAEKPHDTPAIMVGGGPSAADYLHEIRALRDAGGTIYAMNAASQWLRSHGIEPDYQVMSDAKPETATLVDAQAKAHLFASQVNPETLARAAEPILWHLEIGTVERAFPDARRKRGGYALIGGGAATGNCAMCLVYALGHREMHVFGYDSSHRGFASHSYSQPMNATIPTVEVDWCGRVFTCSVAMKAQAEKFQITSQALKQDGCRIEVYGDGLLQHMYRTKPVDMTERDKYRAMWQFDAYREVSPGEELVPRIAAVFEKPGPIIDFGCGTGRAGALLYRDGYEVVLTDFADNCRDNEALPLPFVEWDLCHPSPLRAPYGICTDVMEHIPTEHVDTVLRNIMQAAREVIFQISTVDDLHGRILGQPLHLTVCPHEWWVERLSAVAEIVNEERGPIDSYFHVKALQAHTEH